MSVKEQTLIVISCSTSVVALILSIIALCHTYPNTENLKFDYAGIIVAIFAILVTLLIGWNIYYALDIKKETERNIRSAVKQNAKALKAHSELNAKDFANIIKVLERSENFCNVLDELVFNLYKHKTTNNDVYKQPI